MTYNAVIKWQRKHPFLFGLIAGTPGLAYLEWYWRCHCPVCGARLKKYETPCPECHNNMTWVCNVCNQERCEHIRE